MLWTTQQAARYLSCTEQAVRSRIQKGDIPAVKLAGSGRYLIDPAKLQQSLVPVSSAPSAGGRDESLDKIHERHGR